MERHAHDVHHHAHADAHHHEAAHPPGKSSLVEESEAEAGAESESEEENAPAGKVTSLFSGKVPWSSGSADAAHFKAGGGDATAHAAHANSNPYQAGGNRPHVHLVKAVKGIDQDGKHAVAPAGSEPAVSAVAANEAVLYLHGGAFLVVSVGKLKKAVAPGSHKNLERVIKIRSLDTHRKAPHRGTLHKVALPDGLGQGWKPVHTGGESITGRGNPAIIWGTTNPTGPDGSGTGYVALPMHTGTEFKQLREVPNGVQWVRPDGATGKAVWAEGWAHIHGKWVRQFMVSRIVPDDTTQPPISFLT